MAPTTYVYKNESGFAHTSRDFELALHQKKQHFQIIKGFTNHPLSPKITDTKF